VRRSADLPEYDAILQTTVILLGYDKDGNPVYYGIPKGWYPHFTYSKNLVYKRAYESLVKQKGKDDTQ
jgi:hypothetical protein